MARPDAVCFPRTGEFVSNIDRFKAVDIAEEHLQTGDTELAFVRNQRGECFATRDPIDTIYYPLDHPKSGKPRYRWEDHGNGLKYGYLLESE